MYLLKELSAEASTLLMRHTDLSKKIAKHLPGEIITISAGVQLPLESGQILQITEGTVTLCKGEQKLLYFETDDLVGLEHHKIQGMFLQAEFAVNLKSCSLPQFQDFIKEHSSLWINYLTTELSIFSNLYLNSIPAELDLSPEYRTYEPGEVIITEGDKAEEIFTMIEGQARVSYQGVDVGEINGEELFGVIGSLLNIDRTATVIAVTPCTTLVAPKDKFHLLLSTHPQAVLKCIQHLGHTVTHLNERLVSLVKNSGFAIN